MMIPLGLITSEIPSLCGNMFSQNVADSTISTIIRDGIFLNGTVLYVLLVRSFTVLMCRSISGTCSLFDTTFRVTLSSMSDARIGSNSLSVCAMFTRKPRFAYSARTCLIAIMIVGCFRSLRVSAVLNFIPREIVTRNAILLTYMMSMHSVTSRYRSMIDCGTPSISIATCSPPRRAVFPFSDPRLGPKISSAAVMSFTVMGQFFNRFCFTMLT